MAVLLALDLTRVTREEVVLAQDWFERWVEAEDRTTEAEQGCTSLACRATAAGVDLHIDLALEAGLVEHCENVLTIALFNEELSERLAVDFDVARATLHANARHCSFAAACTPIPALDVWSAENAGWLRDRGWSSGRGLVEHGVFQFVHAGCASFS